MAKSSPAPVTVTGAPRPKVNAKRLQWPPIDPDPTTGQFDPAYVEYTRDLALCENLVRMGSGILKRALRLIVGGPDQGIARAATDGTNIWLPKMHPNRRVVTKHELSHLFFLSDLDLRRAFVLRLIEEVEALMGNRFAQHARDKLLTDLEFFTNILDDIRVNSLWGILYPGDGIALDEWYFGTVGPSMMASAARDYKDGDIDHLFTYAILLCLDQDAKSTEWGEFHDDIRQARDSVLYKAFPASLALTRDLVLRIAKRLAAKMQQPAWGPTSADKDHDTLIQQRVDEQPKKIPGLHKLVTGKTPSPDFVNHNGGFDIQQVDGTPLPPSAPVTNPAKTRQQVDHLYKALQGTEDTPAQLAQFLDGQEAAGIGHAQRIQRSLTSVPATGNFKSEDDYLGKEIFGDLVLTRVAKGDLLRVVLSPADKAVAARWKSRFQQVYGSSRVKLEEDGHELNTEAYIQQRLNGEPLTPYYREVAGRGFRVTLLVDMSGSMGTIFREVERLALGLQQAMDFPFVHLRIVGFRQLAPGQVDITIYPPKPTGLLATRPLLGGNTPLPQAITVASRWMKGRQDYQSIFLLSDGKPVFQMKDTKNPHVPAATLMAWTKEAVATAAANHVSTYAFMIGDDVPSDKEMSFMFGAHNWEAVADKERLFAQSFNLITREFLRFVRRR